MHFGFTSITIFNTDFRRELQLQVKVSLDVVLVGKRGYKRCVGTQINGGMPPLIWKIYEIAGIH